MHSELQPPPALRTPTPRRAGCRGSHLWTWPPCDTPTVGLTPSPQCCWLHHLQVLTKSLREVPAPSSHGERCPRLLGVIWVHKAGQPDPSPGSSLWVPLGFEHSRNLDQRDWFHPMGQKKMRTQLPHSISLAMAGQICSVQLSPSAPKNTKERQITLMYNYENQYNRAEILPGSSPGGVS